MYTEIGSNEVLWNYSVTRDKSCTNFQKSNHFGVMTYEDKSWWLKLIIPSACYAYTLSPEECRISWESFKDTKYWYLCLLKDNTFANVIEMSQMSIFLPFLTFRSFLCSGLFFDRLSCSWQLQFDTTFENEVSNQ